MTEFVAEFVTGNEGEIGGTPPRDRVRRIVFFAADSSAALRLILNQLSQGSFIVQPEKGRPILLWSKEIRRVEILPISTNHRN